MKTVFSFALASLVFVGTSVHAAENTAASAPKTGDSATQASAEMTNGEVRKVDMDTKKITLKHDEIKNLGMPGMTMVFQVKDPAMLEQVKAGDKVKFSAEKMNGALTLTNLEAVK